MRGGGWGCNLLSSFPIIFLNSEHSVQTEKYERFYFELRKRIMNLSLSLSHFDKIGCDAPQLSQNIKLSVLLENQRPGGF